MKILAIDYGKKWIGLAISDDNNRLAFPYKTLENNEKLFSELNGVIKKEEIYKIVIGLPLNKQMKPTPQTTETENWAEKLARQINVPLEFYNEIFTTKEAEKSGAKNQHAVAAAILLQSYLDKKS
ncbi:hypothetical protein A2567_02700 [Candidatus Azambacteria bacterium RIFOXYD1_FULL_42_11]|uniref:Putative pre-16S rRNA nuclease n=4 Tax=Candidatus Azamiibacteriota TaxID=1752741 RepID=A0A0G1BHU9_9BACT|nr:MAG: hypothetical protein UV07_C0013G0021 [Candidatus Azambacteria bacterium GW2011_GWB1_42_17]KKS45876.1 MAG: hypothetical protein UV10_C0012G0022 [Candidatus Azambacteria bacterium GW2011_GWA1_42_19]KKS75247.1 MAG: hypothetical protein UV48_C0015G0005 [Candidatus Azambacteria bacterium GW2011_GWA2_42_9]KKS88344.1 MAG: hypothetical protein UV62_C0009G0021 [Parcubacteria group bacterium GW2011_GWC1_43_11]OGD41943.1 MAG: hypothetical protein A2567_02700 [Candidatus Azambacteria bacterium RIFO